MNIDVKVEGSNDANYNHKANPHMPEGKSHENSSGNHFDQQEKNPNFSNGSSNMTKSEQKLQSKNQMNPQSNNNFIIKFTSKKFF